MKLVYEDIIEPESADRLYFNEYTKQWHYEQWSLIIGSLKRKISSEYADELLNRYCTKTQNHSLYEEYFR